MFSSYWIYFTQKKHSKSCHGNSPRSVLLRVFDHDPDDPLARKSWIPQPFLKKVPLEPIIKTILPGLGVLVELFMNVKYDSAGKSHLVFLSYKVHFNENTGQYSDLNRFYHVCLYSTFVLSGIVDLLSLCVRLPRATSQLFLCFAIYCEAFLFSFHVHGRNLFNNSVHQVLLMFVITTAVFATLRMLNPRNLFINAGLAGSMMLQGTHLIQAGWILYGGTHWDVESHQNVKFVGAVSLWHLFGVNIFMMAFFIAMKMILAKLEKTKWCSSLTVTEGDATVVQERESLIANVEDNTPCTSQNSITMNELTTGVPEVSLRN